MDDCVLYERRPDGVAVVTLNRPTRLNAMTPAMRVEYLTVLARAGSDPEVGAVIVTGAGKGFCAGADFKSMETATPERVRGQVAETHPPDTARRIPKPVIAAINGAVAGIGFAHALMADIRFATPEAKFTTSFARLGMVAELGTSWLLPRIVGSSRAFDLLCSARVFTGQQALEYGLVSELHPREDLLTHAIDYAAGLIKSSSAYSIGQIKHQMQLDEQASWDAALARSFDWSATACGRPEFQQRIASK